MKPTHGTLAEQQRLMPTKNGTFLGNTLKENAPTEPLKANILFHTIHYGLVQSFRAKNQVKIGNLFLQYFQGMYLHGVRKKTCLAKEVSPHIRQQFLVGSRRNFANTA